MFIEGLVLDCLGSDGHNEFVFDGRNLTSHSLSNVKILITLSYGEGCIWTEEFVAEDLGEEDIVGLVLI